MYKHMLIATDGSELAGKAVATGLQLAKALGAKVTAVTVTEAVGGHGARRGGVRVSDRGVREERPPRTPPASWPTSPPRRKKQGVACETVHVTEFPAEGIIETAKDKGCDLIVMASHGRRGLVAGAARQPGRCAC